MSINKFFKDTKDDIDKNINKYKLSTPLFVFLFLLLAIIIWFVFNYFIKMYESLHFLEKFKNPMAIFYVLITFASLMFVIMKFDMVKVFEKYHLITFAVSLSICMTLLIGTIFSLRKILKGDTSQESVFKQMQNFGKMISMFILFGAIIYGILKLTIDNYEISSNILLILIIVGVIIACISFYSYKDKILPGEDSKTYKFTRLIKNIIFYIPCLFYNIIEKVQREMKEAPKEAYLLLLIEAIIIVIYVFIKPIRNLFFYLLMPNGKRLLNKVVSLNTEEVVGTYDELHDNNNDDESKFQYNYSISSWFYLNPNNSINEYFPIINYGTKPIVEFNQFNNKLKIRMLDGKTNKKEIYSSTEILSQKWNHLVINYNGSTLDIFINNKLVSSTPNIVPYMYYDTIVTGSKSNLGGKICNVIYFDETLSKSTITSLYEFYKEKNPPLL